MRVFITGASSGIGAAFARHYAGLGATLGLVARRQDALDVLAADLPVPSHTFVADVVDGVRMREIAVAFNEQIGVPDIVIANAGISVGTLGGEADDLPVLERIFRTNVIGLAATLQPFIAPMRARQSGCLVGIASVAGFRGLPGSGAYSASKAAAINWLEALRAELRGSGVRVCTICPGFIDTPMTRVNPYRMPFLLAPMMPRGAWRGSLRITGRLPWCPGRWVRWAMCCGDYRERSMMRCHRVPNTNRAGSRRNFNQRRS